ncbi:tetratricopeptide repeat-containing serine/threonine-protein kinase [Streptomyces niveus]|uniref:tetratricopeptide repeat-containing protein kinase family protein n=1 Tax=Streptomyces niveus TaxID=193462 RepID=UPI002E370CBD|nr:tetratricopeptide repeat-containing protein kinase family protein [Streptomyces niveus]
MLGRLRDVLAKSGVPLGDEELLDVLWLAGNLPPDAAPLVRARTPAAPEPRPGGQDGNRPTEPSPTTPPEQAGPEPSGDSAPGLPLRAAAQTDGRAERNSTPRRALAVRAPDSRLLDARELRLGKSLRPLRQRFPDHRRHELDVVRTVAAMADTGLPETVTRPVRTRWLSLALLVDDGVSMVLWQRLATEVRTLMERAGAFRDIRVYGLDTRGTAAPRLSTRPYGHKGPYQTPASVSDPTGNTLVLVVSDGVGEAWWDGRMRDVTQLWARCGPTAVVHALPTRLWANSGITAQRWRVATHRRGGPNTDWHITDPVLPPELVTFDSVPVPVLEPSPAAVEGWARLIASPGTTAQLPLWSAGRPATGRLFADTRQGDVADAVLRFRESASPEAYRLAAHLAAVAPVTPPVMRLVQNALGPPTDNGHIVEVFLGGLMRQTTAAWPTHLPQHQLFDFSDEARRLLLGALSPQELLRNTRSVTRQLEAAVGRSSNFPAWVGHPDGTAVIADTDRSFGWLKERLLRRLGVPPVSAGAGSALATRPVRLPEARHETQSEVALEGWPPGIPPGWSQLLPSDPQRLGRYRLYARSTWGWDDPGIYLAQDEDGTTVLMRTPTPLYSMDPRQARELIRTEAECLERMQGSYAPGLLDWNDGRRQGTPWLAASYVRRREDDPSSEPAPNLHAVFEEQAGPVSDGLFRRVGGDLARAVRHAHNVGLVHGTLAPRTVLVSDHGVRLVGWMTATRDGVHSDHLEEYPRSEVFLEAGEDSPGPTRESDIYSVGALLLALATDRWNDFRPDEAALATLAASEIDPRIVEVLWACLDPDPAARPTADELVGAFAPGSVDETDPEGSAEDLASAENLVLRYRALAQRQPGLHRAELASALKNLSHQLSDLGRRGEALDAITEAVGLYRELAVEHPAAGRPDLARGLNNLAVRLGDAGRQEESLAAITEAVQLFRELATEDPHYYRAALGTTLNNLANRLSHLGRREDALAVITEAVELYQELAADQADSHHPEVARSLNNLANRFGEVGRHEEGLEAITEAVRLYRELALQHPRPYIPALASSLTNLAVRLGAVGRREEALAALREGLEIRRVLAETRPDVYREDLEQSLRVQSWLLDGDSDDF